MALTLRPLTPAQEAEVAQIALDHAKRRWPFANRVTNPQLMDVIEELKAKIRRADEGAKG